MQLRVAEGYIEQCGNLAKASTTTILPATVADVASMIATAMSVIPSTASEAILRLSTGDLSKKMRIGRRAPRCESDDVRWSFTRRDRSLDVGAGPPPTSPLQASGKRKRNQSPDWMEKGLVPKWGEGRFEQRPSPTREPLRLHHSRIIQVSRAVLLGPLERATR